MIPVFDAIEFIKVMDGGSTRPWQVNVIEDGVPVSYVVKLYTAANNEQNCTVLKECICSNLAKQFDIETPDIALINFTPDFVSSLPQELQDTLSSKDQRLKFATKLIAPPYDNYSPQLGSAYLMSYDIATIYAFDNLILNEDRRIDKPNMFFKNKNVLLIDHELSLATTANANISITTNSAWTHNFKRHIFHEGNQRF